MIHRTFISWILQNLELKKLAGMPRYFNLTEITRTPYRTKKPVFRRSGNSGQSAPKSAQISAISAPSIEVDGGVANVDYRALHEVKLFRC